MGSRRTLRSADWRFGGGLLIFFLLGIFGLWWTFRNSAPEQAVQHLHASSDFHSSRQSRRSQGPSFVIQHLEGRQRASFAVFRTSPEPLPWSMRRAMRRPIYGINWGLAQRLPIRDPARAWAVPGDGYICILGLQVRHGRGAVGATCARTKAALAHGLAMTFLSGRGTGVVHASSRVIVGIAPDRAREVIAKAPKSTVRIPVVSGIFIQRDTATYPPDRFRLID
jgi:hypothetical protein